MVLAPTTRDGQTKVIGILALSLLLHIPIIFGLTTSLLIAQQPYEPSNNRSEPMRVRIINTSDALSNLKLDDQQRAEEEKEKEEEQKRDKPRPSDMLPYRPDEDQPEERPDDARFSGRKETRARRDQVKRGAPGTSTPSNIAGDPSTPRDYARRGTVTEKPQQLPERPRKLSAQSKPDEREKILDEEDLSETSSPDVILPTEADDAEAATSDIVENEARKGVRTNKDAPNADSLFPSEASMSAMSNERGNRGFQFMKDVDESELTLLNRRRNRYWTFWDRMQRQVKREWHPARELRKRDPYGNVYGIGVFYTRVHMVLNSDGSIQRLNVIKTCGLEFFDDEAVRALLAAGPFPNPPEGLKDEDGLIHIKFGFAIEVSDGGELNLFRAKPENPF